MRLAAAALALSVAAACGPGSLDSIQFTKEESLPGFDVALPTGMTSKRSTSEISGELSLTGRGAMVVVSWRAGNVSTDEMKVMGSASMEMIGRQHGGGDVDELPVEVAAPDRGLRFLMPMRDHRSLVLTIIQCEKANVTVFAMSEAGNDRARALRFHQRFASTVRCRQDAAPLAIDADLPAFELADDGGYLHGSAPPVFYSTRGAQWTVVSVPDSGHGAPVPDDFVKTILTRIGLNIVEEHPVAYQGPAPWKLFEITADAGGEQLHMLHGLLPCADGKRYLVLYVDVTAPDRPSPSAFDRVGCPTARVDPAALPSAVARFTAACKAGDGHACAYQAILGESEPALLGGADRDTLLARACELGVKDVCPAR